MKGINMINEVIKKLVETNKNISKAYKYDLVYRDYDDMVELIGLVDDPTYDMKDFEGREMLFPKRWLTLEVYDSKMEVLV
jgi:hypothetical protein